MNLARPTAFACLLFFSGGCSGLFNDNGEVRVPGEAVGDDDATLPDDDTTPPDDDTSPPDDDTSPPDDDTSPPDDDDGTPPDDDSTPVTDDDSTPPLVEPPAEFAEVANGVVILVLDTIRADHVGCSEKKGLIPTLEAFMDAGSCFDRTKSNTAWTTPGTAAILSGTHGQTHQILQQNEDVLNPDILLAPEIFGAEGYVNAQSSANRAATKAGLIDRFQFDYNNDYLTELNDRVVDIHLVDRIVEFLDAHVPTPDTPFFLHVQFYSPHYPLCPQEATIPTLYEDYDFCDFNDAIVIGDEVMAGNEELLEIALQLYAEDTAQTDQAVQALMRALQERGLLENTLFGFTGDHSEAFNEHGNWGHSVGLTFDQVDVPLAFWGPGIPRGVKSPISVSGVDVLPTLLDYTALPIPVEVEGRSLRALMEDPDGPHLSRTFQILGEADGDLRYGVTSNGYDGTAWTLIQTTLITSLYHTEVDPEELVDLADDPDSASALAWLQEMMEDPILPWDEWEMMYGE